ncbi:MAG: ABC transporter ATP-binding protein [Rhizobiaceae bacterium]
MTRSVKEPPGAGIQALNLSGLKVSFPMPVGEVEAVKGVDLSLTPGRVLAVIGESGSGKSSVLMAIAGLLPPAAKVSGTMTLADLPGDVLAPGPSRKGIAGRRIGMVFQNPSASLNPVLTIGAQIDEVVRTHQPLRGSAVREATLSLLDRVGIGDVKRRAAAYPHHLSGGLKQRVAIAAALAGQPRLILADEPTTALDATVQAQILDLLLDLVDREQVGLMLVTHDMAVAGSVADEIAVIYAGRVVERGPSRATLRAPAHPYTASLIAASLPLTAAGAASPNDTPLRELLPPEAAATTIGCDYAPRCPIAAERCHLSRPPLEPFGAGMVACFEAGKAIS